MIRFILRHSILFHRFQLPNSAKADYENMRMHMIYGESVPFDELVGNLKELNDRVKKLHII